MKLLTTFCAAVMLLLTTNDASAQLSRVCRTQITVPGNGLFIYKQSAPLRAGGVGTRLIGYRKEPTLIMNRNVSNRGTAQIYDSRGRQIGSCPWASAEGHSGGRLRCTMQTSALRRTAVKNTGNPAVWFRYNSRTSACAKVSDAGRCYGSSKGLCSQTIR